MPDIKSLKIDMGPRSSEEAAEDLETIAKEVRKGDLSRLPSYLSTDPQRGVDISLIWPDEHERRDRDVVEVDKDGYTRVNVHSGRPDKGADETVTFDGDTGENAEVEGFVVLQNDADPSSRR